MRTWILTTWILYLLMSLYILDLVNGNENCRFGESCSFSCHCKHNALCDPHIGHCDECDDGLRPGEPDFYSGAWWGPACQIGNIAYGKTATQLHTYKSLNASHAIDGYKGYPFQVAHCAHPNSENQWTPTWWRVELGELHLVYNVTILTRAANNGTPAFLDRLWNTYIGVGNYSTPDKTYHAQCAFIKENDADFNYTKNTVNKQCAPDLVGIYVSLQRTGGNEVQYMNFCEVYVTGYKVRECSGSWGPGCLTPCNCDSQCHLVTGYCNTACLPGWTGPNCQKICKSGNFGEGCSNQCYCENNKACHHVTGACPQGRCAPRYGGPTCSYELCSDAFEEKISRDIGYSSQCPELEVEPEKDKTNCMRRACELRANVINYDGTLCSMRKCEMDLKLSKEYKDWDVLKEVRCGLCLSSSGVSSQYQETTNPLPVYAIVLICIGTLVLIVALAVSITCWIKRRKPQNGQADNNTATTPEVPVSQDNPSNDVYDEITEPTVDDVNKKATEYEPYDFVSKAYENLNMEDINPPVPSVYSSVEH